MRIEHVLSFNAEDGASPLDPLSRIIRDGRQRISREQCDTSRARQREAFKLTEADKRLRSKASGNPAP
jgi:hypothetical protein